MFFALSGYLITASALNLRTRRGATAMSRSFWLRRLARLYPLYIVSTLVYALWVHPEVWRGDDALWQAVSHLLMLHHLTPSTAGSINGVTWSLGVELNLYLLAFLWVRYGGAQHIGRLAAATVLAVLLWRWWVYAQVPEPLQAFAAHQAIGLMDGFAAGAVIAALQQRGVWSIAPSRRAALGWLAAAVGLFSLCITLMEAADGGYWQRWDLVLSIRSMSALASIFLLRAALHWDSAPVPKSALALGRWSYGIYLWQLGFIALITRLSINPLWQLVGAVLGTIILSALTYRWIELPAMAWAKRRDLPQSTRKRTVA